MAPSIDDEHDDPATDKDTGQRRKDALDQQDSEPGKHDPDFDPTTQYRGVPNDGRIGDESDGAGTAS